MIANNIANINTTGFKRARAEFTDLLYETQRLPGVAQRGTQGAVPEGAQLGLGVKTAAIRNLHIQGALAQTGNQFDLALTGRGFFQIHRCQRRASPTPAPAPSTPTRTGQLVTLDGNLDHAEHRWCRQNTTAGDGQLSPASSPPPSPATTTPVQLGQLTLANFANEVGLQPLGNNLYKETAASGHARRRRAGRSGLRDDHARLSRKSSNVDPVEGDHRPHLRRSAPTR